MDSAHTCIKAIILVLLTSFPSAVYSRCDLPQVIHVNETAGHGTVLFDVNKNASDAVSYVIKMDVLNPAQKSILRSHFLLEPSMNNLSFKLTLNKTLNLEFFYMEFHLKLLTIPLSVTCNGEHDVFLNVAPVNENPPTFVNAPFFLRINENADVNVAVLSVAQNVSDLDVVSSPNFFFYILPYGVPEFGAERYFEFRGVTNGQLFRNASVELDYDTMTHHNLGLNISVWDGAMGSVGAMSSHALVNITVLNVHDQAPYFVYPDCPMPCIAPGYSAWIRETDTGFLTIRPRVITAMDPDMIPGTRLLYRIQSGNVGNMFSIDQNTGSLYQASSVKDHGFNGTEIRLVIEVKKDLSIDLSAIAILTISIYGRADNKTEVPPIGESREPGPGSDLLIPVVILGIILALLIVALVVVVVLYRRKQQQLTVAPDGEKSEPQTEEEDIGTDKEDYNNSMDNNQRLVFGNKVTLAIGTADFPDTNGVPAGRLPPLPLKDTATETEEEKKKKRSRRRNRNKEPEIFDGTREYNMGLEAEFYEAPDKAKVKRSQRSYDKKTNPALWIKVPNDQPAPNE